MAGAASAWRALSPERVFMGLVIGGFGIATTVIYAVVAGVIDAGAAAGIFVIATLIGVVAALAAFVRAFREGYRGD